MATRYEIAKSLLLKYKEGSKKEKEEILNWFIGVTGYNRSYAGKLGIDSDNGAEFINSHLKRYCEERNITFTRARPYRKNDNSYVEQKNWSIVRKTVGYFRYEGEKEVNLLNAVYEKLRLYTIFSTTNEMYKENQDRK